MRAMRVTTGMIGALLFSWLGMESAAAETLRFAITRNGDQIGTHTIDVKRDAQQTTVSIATDLTVKVLFVTAYHFQYTASEDWINGRLVGLSSATDNNGTPHKVSIVMKENRLEMEADGKTSRLDPNVMPGSLWTPELLRRSTMLDPQDGQILPLTVLDDGMDDLPVNGRTLKAHHYTLKSRYSQDVWYDDQQHLVQARIIGSDGSVILYVPL